MKVAIQNHREQLFERRLQLPSFVGQISLLKVADTRDSGRFLNHHQKLIDIDDPYVLATHGLGQ